MAITRKQLNSFCIDQCTNDTDAVAVKDAVYLVAAGKVAPASAGSGHRVFGLVCEVIDSTTCRVQTRGLFEGFSTGMTFDDNYFLGTSGALTTTAPANQQRVGIAFNATDLFLRIDKAQEVVSGAFQVTTDGSLTLTTQNTWYALDDSGSLVCTAVDSDLFTHGGTKNATLTYQGTDPCWALITVHFFGGSSQVNNYQMGISHNGAAPDLFSRMRLAGSAETYMMQRAIYVSNGDTLEINFRCPDQASGQVQTHAGTWLSAVGLNLK